MSTRLRQELITQIERFKEHNNTNYYGSGPAYFDLISKPKKNIFINISRRAENININGIYYNTYVDILYTIVFCSSRKTKIFETKDFNKLCNKLARHKLTTLVTDDFRRQSNRIEAEIIYNKLKEV
jgi:hypothetical protein